MRIIPIVCLLLIVVSGQVEESKTKIGVFPEITRKYWESGRGMLKFSLKYFLKKEGAEQELFFYDDPFDQIKEQLNSFDGVIIPARVYSNNLSAEEEQNYNERAKMIYNYANEINLPVLGIGEGLSVIYSIESGNEIPKHFYDKNENQIFEVPENIQDQGILKDGQSFKFLWSKGIGLGDFNSSPKLRDNFEITSLSKRLNEDHEEVWTVTSFQSKDYPIYAVQFEPQDDKNYSRYGKNFLTFFLRVVRQYREKNFLLKLIKSINLRDC